MLQWIQNIKRRQTLARKYNPFRDRSYKKNPSYPMSKKESEEQKDARAKKRIASMSEFDQKGIALIDDYVTQVLHNISVNATATITDQLWLEIKKMFYAKYNNDDIGDTVSDVSRDNDNRE